MPSVMPSAIPSAIPSASANPTRVTRLPNGVRVVTLRRPQVASASVSVYVASGSLHEPRAFNGLHHALEHMVFKGTATRDARRINLDAERLGAEVDAHTDKDHTAFHLRGLAEHATEFVRLLGDLLTAPTFPEDEVERERQVLLHEFADDEDDPVATAFKLFDRACWGSRHPAGWPVIGTRQTLERFTREDLARFARERFVGATLVVGAAGDVDPQAVERAAERAFGALPVGTAPDVEPPVFVGEFKSRRWSGTGQVQLVMGWPRPPLREGDAASRLAATLLGEGMSSPLMYRLREQRALAYYASCSADLFVPTGQFVVEASTAPAQVAEVVAETLQAVAAQAERLDRDDLERARRQLAVRLVRAGERPARELEDAALDLFALGRVRDLAERRAEIEDLPPRRVREVFAGLQAATPAVALTGPVGRSMLDGVRAALAA
jgi:predicted Zn-dependent peptidase